MYFKKEEACWLQHALTDTLEVTFNVFGEHIEQRVGALEQKVSQQVDAHYSDMKKLRSTVTSLQADCGRQRSSIARSSLRAQVKVLRIV